MRKYTAQDKWRQNHKSRVRIYHEHSGVRYLLRHDHDAEQLKWILAEMNKDVSRVSASVVIVPKNIGDDLVKKGIAERK